MASGALPADIRVECGFGSAPDEPSPTWTDVSDWVDMAAGLDIKGGRSAERSSISPRTLDFTLDNRDRRFDPRNASGPYYGDLAPRVPVRVTATYSATTYTIYRGYVDGGWPQDYTQLTRFVPITCVDAAGWAAAAAPPRSAFEGETTRLRAEGAVATYPYEVAGWLRPQSDGTWVDQVTGHSFPHSTRLVDGDPLVDGDEESGWGEEVVDEGIGSGGSAVDVSTRLGPLGLANPYNALVVLFVRARAASSPLVLHRGDGTDAEFVRIMFGATGAAVTIEYGHTIGATNYGRLFQTYAPTVYPWGIGAEAILDGRTHMVTVVLSHTMEQARLHIDGQHYPLIETNYDGVAIPQRNWTAIGRRDTQGIWTFGDELAEAITTDDFRLYGAMDHVQWWTGGTIHDTIADLLWRAARVARAGDRMDERLSWLLDASGWRLVGTLDGSLITTQQGYRRAGSVVELLQRLEDTEQGRVWVDNLGQFRFAARPWPHTMSTSATIQATFGDTGSDLPYSAAMSRIVDDDRHVVNVAQVKREYGTQQIAENAASIALYGRRSRTLSNLLYHSDKQSRAVAEWLVDVHGEAQPRVEVLSFSPLNVPATLVPLACQVEPGWLLRVKRDSLTFDGHVVDVSHRISLDAWDVSVQLDGTRANEAGFTWDDGTGTVGSAWDDGTGTTVGAAPWTF